MIGQWLVPLAKSSAADFGIVCFPWAGGGPAGFHPFKAHVGNDLSLWGVSLPGRQHRLADLQDADLGLWVEAIGEELVRLPDHPLVLFGHSFGAIVAFEVAQWLADRQHDVVSLLCVSSRRAPGLPSRHPNLSQASDDELISWMRGLGGAHDELLSSAEMLDVMLRPLRDDLMLDAAYRPHGPALHIPMLALAGRHDPLIDVAEVRGWQEWTTAEFELQVLPGDHFHLNERRQGVIDLIRHAVSSGKHRRGDRQQTRHALK